ncbi:unnamed protein product [Mytilus coruscus]|uniref:Endonuclease/exonuclease/phosphatase domain-containing protein n=1 Tax=Mytilus coruscus TaxID=42192 RepID=A0A6J8BKI1_MYTCO|nr:unnamed protein product [Mytilus coruscus]
MEMAHTSGIDVTSIEEEQDELDESKSSNDSKDHEILGDISESEPENTENEVQKVAKKESNAISGASVAQENGKNQTNTTKQQTEKEKKKANKERQRTEKRKNSNANLICLQETGELNRSTKIDIESTTNFKIYSSDGEKCARGVCIFISKDVKEIIEQQVPGSLKGNLLHLEFTVESKKYHILNIYSPVNATRPQTEFYKQLDKYTELINAKTDVVIFGRDFNLITTEKLKLVERQ